MNTPACAGTREAFTLLEILIVLAIIGVLLVSLFTAVDFAQKKVKTMQGINNARALTRAAISYAAEHSGRTPQTDFSSIPDPAGYARWVDEVAPYVYEKIRLNDKGRLMVDGTFRCPGLNGYKQYGNKWRFWSWDSVDWINVRNIRPDGGAAVWPNTRVHLLNKTPWIISSDKNVVGSAGLIEKNQAGFDTYVPPSVWIFNGGVIVGYLDGHVEIVQEPSSTNTDLFKK